jgi:hypothetical protein
MPGILFFINSSGKLYDDKEDISAIGGIRMLATTLKPFKKVSS